MVVLKVAVACGLWTGLWLLWSVGCMIHTLYPVPSVVPVCCIIRCCGVRSSGCRIWNWTEYGVFIICIGLVLPAFPIQHSPYILNMSVSSPFGDIEYLIIPPYHTTTGPFMVPKEPLTLPFLLPNLIIVRRTPMYVVLNYCVQLRYNIE